MVKRFLCNSDIMKELFKSIDKLISLIKEKGDKENFNFEDIKVILSLEIIRLELSEFGELTDKSFGAFSTISAWSQHYYKGVHNDIYEMILAIDTELYKYNSNEFKGDIKSPTGNRKEDWYGYFGGSIRNILESK